MTKKEFTNKLEALLCEATMADSVMLNNAKEYGKLIETTINYLKP